MTTKFRVIHKNLQQIEDMKAKVADTGVVLTAYQSEKQGHEKISYKKS